MALAHLALSDLERSPDFEALYHRGTQLGPMLLLNINRKPYVSSRMELSNLTLGDLER